MAELDAQTAAGGARDAGAASVVGAPYLRADRFIASFANEVETAEEHADWLERMRAADEDARGIELANLGMETPARSASSPFPALSVSDSIRACGELLVRRDLRSPERKASLRRLVAVPDTYSPWRRVVGVYPLTRWLFREGIAASHRERRVLFAAPLDHAPRQGELRRYAPPAAEPLTADAVSEILKAASRNTLRVPQLKAPDLDRLYGTFAPVWEIETLNRNDRPGKPRWVAPDQPDLDVDAPAVYRYTSYTRFRRDNLVQLNFLIWFRARPSSTLLDLHAGRLDGVIWRVTLATDGRVLAYDTIRPSGFDYQLYPGIGYRVVQPTDGSEPVLSPYPLQPPRTGERLTIRLSAGRHGVDAVYADGDRNLARLTYHWREYRELRSLPNRSAGRRSLFGPNGLVGRTQRLERWLLWPSGIASPGAMRQAGTHAITLVGKRHFDDARLLQQLVHPL